jgi:hypothetical protein
MPVKVKSISINDTPSGVVALRDFQGLKPSEDFSVSTIGGNVDALDVAVELDAAAAATEELPAQITVEVRSHEPRTRRPGKGSLPAPVPMMLRANGNRFRYSGRLTVGQLTAALKPDGVPEIATVVREGGTSDQKFRKPLIEAGWQLRGTAVLPDKGKPVRSGGVKDDQPDATMLFETGGVEVLEVRVRPGNGVECPVDFSVWALMSSPADIFFYSGHGLLTTGNLVRSRGFFPDYQDWLSPTRLLEQWGRAPNVDTAPMDLDVLIINGCSVLFWNRNPFEQADRRNIGLDWAKLLVNKDGPLRAILGYRYRAPADQPWGNRVAEEMAKSVVNLGTRYDQYARRWLEINSAMGGKAAHVGWSAAAYDCQGYWYINTPYSEGAHGRPIKAVGYDPSKKPGAILGPFPVP